MILSLLLPAHDCFNQGSKSTDRLASLRNQTQSKCRQKNYMVKGHHYELHEEKKIDHYLRYVTEVQKLLTLEFQTKTLSLI